MSDLVKQELPSEIAQIIEPLNEDKKNEVQLVLNHVFSGVSKLKDQLALVNVEDHNDKSSMQIARTIRLSVRERRLEAEKTFDLKRQEVQAKMLSFKTEGQLWLKTKQIMQSLTKEIEELAKYKEETAKRYEEEQKELKIQDRIKLVSQFNTEISRFEFENMADATFDTFLNSLKVAHEAKIKEEQAERERLEKIAEIKRLHQTRFNDILPYYQFLDDKNINLGEITEDQFQDLKQKLNASKKKHDKDQEKLRKEKERLEKEAEKAKEKLKLQKIEQDKKEAEQKRINDAKLKKEAEEKEALRLKLEEIERTRKAEQEAKEKAEKEKAQKEAEEKRKALNAPDKEKISELILKLDKFEFPKVTGIESKEAVLTCQNQFKKIISYLEKVQEKL